MQEQAMREACVRFIEDSVFPIIYVSGDEKSVDFRGDILGTGFLVEDRPETFLVTAAHVLDIDPGMEPGRITFPLNGQNSDVVSLSPEQFVSDRTTNADVAVVRLSYGQETLKDLHWNSFTLESFQADPQMVQNQETLVYGFPSEYQEDRDGDPTVYLKTIGFTTKLYGGNLSSVPQYDPQIDILFEYKNTLTIDGQQTKTPMLQGISGSAMFSIDYTIGSGIWTPRSALKIVGLEKAVKRGEYIRATRSSLIGSSLAHLISRLRSGAK